MMAEMDSWDVILVIKMDRIHRNSRNFMAMMDRLNRNGKMFVSSTESLDTTNALGRFVVDMIQRLSQLESEQIGERTHMGMREKAESLESSDSRKRTMGFTAPFGYRLEDGRLVAEPDEMRIVNRIFAEYLDGSPMDWIAFSLNNEGRLTRKGNPWNKFNIRNILHNPVYAGFMRWEDLLIRHDAETVLSPEEFNSLQERMASRTRDPRKRNVDRIPDCYLRWSPSLLDEPPHHEVEHPVGLLELHPVGAVLDHDLAVLLLPRGARNDHAAFVVELYLPCRDRLFDIFLGRLFWNRSEHLHDPVLVEQEPIQQVPLLLLVGILVIEHFLGVLPRLSPVEVESHDLPDPPYSFGAHLLTRPG